VTDSSEWRQPSPSERALFDVLALAAADRRATVSRQLAAARVADDAAGGLSLEVSTGVPLLDPVPDGELLAAQGIDRAGRRVLVALHVAGGSVVRLEIAPLDGPAAGLPEPGTLRLLDGVPRGTPMLRWMVPHERTILEEMAGR
jgi:hypothetical protein